jgi:molybdopterin molybdotransferase
LGEKKNKIKISRVAMRPGKPLIFGNIQGMPMLGLPGNPVSAGVTAMLFLVPTINKLLGSDNYKHPIESAVTALNLEENDSRQDYLRAKLNIEKTGKLSVTPFNYQDSSMLLNFAKADCLIIRPPFAKALKKGNLVKIIRLNTFL